MSDRACMAGIRCAITSSIGATIAQRLQLFLYFLHVAHAWNKPIITAKSANSYTGFSSVYLTVAPVMLQIQTSLS